MNAWYVMDVNSLEVLYSSFKEDEAIEYAIKMATSSNADMRVLQCVARIRRTIVVERVEE